MSTQETQKATQLPQPSGYRILCAIPRMEEMFDDSVLIKADITHRIS